MSCQLHEPNGGKLRDQHIHMLDFLNTNVRWYEDSAKASVRFRNWKEILGM